mgnify:FL=1|jgi:hypothetical protein
MTIFLQALFAGVLLAVAVLLAWRLAQRIGLLLPRRRAQHDKLLCVRPLDLDD